MAGLNKNSSLTWGLAPWKSGLAFVVSGMVLGEIAVSPRLKPRPSLRAAAESPPGHGRVGLAEVEASAFVEGTQKPRAWKAPPWSRRG